MEFSKKYEVDYDMTKAYGVLMFNPIIQDPLVDFYSNPKNVTGFYVPKIEEYYKLRYQEWNDPDHPHKGWVRVNDLSGSDNPSNIIKNPNFDPNFHEVFGNLPPEFIKYGPEIEDFFDTLLKFVTFIATLPGANIILKFLDKRPTVLAPWQLWEEHLVEEKTGKINMTNDSFIDCNMSVDQLANITGISPEHFSAPVHGASQANKIDGINSKIFLSGALNINELTPNSSALENSILQILSNPINTPIYSKTPKRQPAGNFAKKSKLVQSPYQKVSVKMSAKKVPGASRLALDFDDLEGGYTSKKSQVRGNEEEDDEDDDENDDMQISNDDSDIEEATTVKEKHTHDPNDISGIIASRIQNRLLASNEGSCGFGFLGGIRGSSRNIGGQNKV